jgi:hypothetical protein
LLTLPVWLSLPATSDWSRPTVSLVAIGIAIQLVALVFQWQTVLTGSLIGAVLVALLTFGGSDGPGLFAAALLGTALLLACEFGFWSLEIPPGRRETGAAITRRLGRIGILAGFGLIVSLACGGIAGAPVHGSTLLTGLAVAVAFSGLGLAVVWTRRTSAQGVEPPAQ